MKKYRCLLNGHNFLINIDGRNRKHGFYQTVFVEADNPKQAESLAVAKIRHNKELKEKTLNSQDDPPAIRLETIWEFDIADDVGHAEAGRTFYPEKKWWQFWK